jgi:hypothetical protein
MRYRTLGGPRRRRPEPREQEALVAIGRIAACFARHDDEDASCGVLEASRKAVEVYLIRATLGWEFAAIARHVGVSHAYAIRIHDRGRKLVRDAAKDEVLTPGMVAQHLGDKIFI